MGLRKTTIALAVTASLVTAGAGPGAPAHAAGPACTPTWRLVSTPPLPDGVYISPLPQPGGSDVATSTGGTVDAVSAVGRDSVWFTGSHAGSATSFAGPWLLHADGRKVSQPKAQVVPPPLRTGFASSGTSSFDSDTDGWALWSLPTAFTTPYGERWHDGRWTSVPFAPSPDAAKYNVQINDVVAISPTDAWAVGTRYEAGVALGFFPMGSVVEHWDGSSWSVVPDPAATRENAGLNAVAVIAADDVWAVGELRTGGDAQRITPLLEHWDGKRWTVAEMALGEPEFFAGLSSVSATRGGDVWAAGFTLDRPSSQGGVRAPLVAHYDGTSWHAVGGLPDLGGGIPTTVYAAAAQDAWTTAVNPQTNETTFLHWTGRNWTSVPVPGPKAYGLTYTYTAMDGTGPTDVWAVGSVANGAYTTDTPQIAHLSCHSGRA
ncbi:MAG TPA: hypothetical protein VF053_18400 [Streptosporangiales bacterium]